MFLGSVVAIALAPTAMLNPKPKMRAIDVRWVDSLGRWVPDWWCQHALYVGCCVRYTLTRKLGEYGIDIKGQDVKIYYSDFGWRGMKHNFLGYVDIPNNGMGSRKCATEYSYEIQKVHDHVTSHKIMCMDYSMIDYPDKKYWDDLQDYGNTVAHIAQERFS